MTTTATPLFTLVAYEPEADPEQAIGDDVPPRPRTPEPAPPRVDRPPAAVHPPRPAETGGPAQGESGQAAAAVVNASEQVAGALSGEVRGEKHRRGPGTPTFAGARSSVRRDRAPLVPGSVRVGARDAAAKRRAEVVVRIALEVFDGHRPLTHLAPYATPEVLRYVGAGVPRRGAEAVRGAAVRSVHCRPMSRTAAEVAAVCRFGTRYRALAARLDLTATGDWRCTALRVL
jgi:hypothetical protein